MTRRGLGLGRVGAVVLVAGGLTTIGALLWQRTGRLIPEPPLLTGVLLLVLGGLLPGVAWPVRSYLRGRRPRLDPLRAARALVLAQAGALTWALLTGWYAGQLAVVLGGLDLLVYHDRAWRFGLLAVVSVLLIGAGLWAQSWCRFDPPSGGVGPSSEEPPVD